MKALQIDGLDALSHPTRRALDIFKNSAGAELPHGFCRASSLVRNTKPAHSAISRKQGLQPVSSVALGHRTCNGARAGTSLSAICDYA